MNYQNQIYLTVHGLGLNDFPSHNSHLQGWAPHQPKSHNSSAMFTYTCPKISSYRLQTDRHNTYYMFADHKVYYIVDFRLQHILLYLILFLQHLQLCKIYYKMSIKLQ